VVNDNFQEARELALSALQEQPNSRTASGILVTIARQRAAGHLQQGHVDEAITEYTDLHELPFAENWQAVVEAKLANLHEYRGDIETAIRVYQRLIWRHPSLSNWCAWACYELIRLYQRQGDEALAKEELATLLSHYPYASWTRMARSQFNTLLDAQSDAAVSE
jgi:tetratricopeptide (TPR) repeat protein